LDISGGLCGFVVKGRENEQGYFSDVTEVIKQNIKVPVILTGGIRDIKVADRLIEAGKADLIGIGRAMYKDSNWAEKALIGYRP
jgi:NADPH2 dehydrogenase